MAVWAAQKPRNLAQRGARGLSLRRLSPAPAADEESRASSSVVSVMLGVAFVVRGPGHARNGTARRRHKRKPNLSYPENLVLSRRGLGFVQMSCSCSPWPGDRGLSLGLTARQALWGRFPNLPTEAPVRRLGNLRHARARAHRTQPYAGIPRPPQRSRPRWVHPSGAGRRGAATHPQRWNRATLCA